MKMKVVSPFPNFSFVKNIVCFRPKPRTDEDVKIASEIDEHVQNNRKRSFRVNVIN